MSKTNKKIVAIVQARMTSTRLPGKVLMDIEGKPMLKRVIGRLSLAKLVDEIVLAIPDTKENDVLENFAKENNIIYVRASENDVLGRYYKAAKQFEADVIVRITADCPLVTPEIVDNIVEQHLNSCFDYTSNVIKRSFPKGLDVEVFNFNVLEKLINIVKQPEHREHVTLYILENSEVFKTQNVSAEENIEWPGLRLTVDTKQDLEVIRKVYQHFKETDFSIKQVISFLAVNLRKAEKRDIKFLFNLRNKDYVYENSRTARPIEWDEHINWVNPVIDNKTNKQLFIIEYRDPSALFRTGQLRLDYDDDTAEVSISLLKEFHQKSIASTAVLNIILKSKKENKLKILLAEVNEKNPASQRLFEKAGFKQESREGEWLKYELNL